VQTVLNKLGQRLKPDGLYGPKTVSAWRSTARARRLSDAIMRLGPKTVDVDARTLAALKQTAKVAGASYDDQLYIP
jgi:peptidoglycan hydrolase-like protein with peptidoglycan-binding domain